MTDTSQPSFSTDPRMRIGFVAVLLALTAWIFWPSFVEMERLWQQPDYSHGYLIPFLAAYLFIVRIPALVAARPEPSWLGLGLLLLALAVLLIGELSALFVITQNAFLITVWAMALTVWGVRGVKAIWASLAMLVFLVPLPVFVQYNLSSNLQFISTDLSAWVLRLLGIPVYVEGNVIDMGISKLQVVEACSGLRYLFPLMCFSFLCGYLYKGPLWHRWLIFLSSIPVTIVMNSIRIAVTGILYDNYGIGAGDTFMHFFEGWVIFVGCLAILFAEMMLLAKLQGRGLDKVLDVGLPSWSDIRPLGDTLKLSAPVLAVIPMLVLVLAASTAVAGRTEVVPERQSLYGFPLVIGDWRGREVPLSEQELDVLKLTDYVSANYQHEEGGFINFYVAYYESQRKGASVHSPRACLPGGGWEIQSSGVVRLPGVLPDGGDLPVNQIIIGMGESRQLVNYWFMQRGRNLTNEYLVKWYIFWDSLTKQRTDGAMVRVITPLPSEGGEEVATKSLEDFIRLVEPRLYYYVPQEVTPYQGAAAVTGALDKNPIPYQ